MTHDDYLVTHDPARLAALRSLALLDSPPELAFDRLTRLVSRLLRAPIAFISLVDEHRQFLKSCIGLPEPWCSRREMPLSFSFCQHLVASGEPLIIADARAHPLVQDNPAVRELSVVAYAGIPLTTVGGHVLGGFCAVDKVPRLWNKDEIELLQDLAAAVMTEIELRRGFIERERAEAVLRESERRFRAIFDQTFQLIGLLDLQGTVLETNQTALDFGGHTRAEVIGRPFWEMHWWSISRATQERLRAAIAEAAQGNFVRYEVDVLDADDIVTTIDFSLKPVRDETGKVVLLIPEGRDITERRRIEAALRESEEQYRLITENSSDLISLCDQEGHCIYVSPSVRQVLGYSPASLIGRWTFDFVHPDDLASAMEQWRKITVQNTVRTEYRSRHADGSWCWIEAEGSAIERQGMRYVVTVGRDITERKQLEAQFLQAQKMESVGRLAGGVAHDFNNLLMAIMGYADLALNTLPPNHVARSDMAEILKAADRAANLTRQLLAFARRQIIEPHVLNLNDLILDMDKLLRRLIGEDITLVTLPAPDLDLVKADPGQIEQVLINLAVNARDAMIGGGKLTIETSNLTIDHDYARQHVGLIAGSYVLLVVSDTGIGMDDKVKRRLFEPFFTTKEPGKGTGLGLATCYGIVKQHGGSIYVDSKVGQGTSFKIYLPRVEGKANSWPRRANVDQLPRGTETVLLVEDELAVRGLAARVLRQQGYTVLEAADGEMALRIAQGYKGARIDLLLTDVVMPEMGGHALAELLLVMYPDIKVLFMSGYTDASPECSVSHHREVCLLSKPFSPAILARKVREALDHEL